MLFLARVLGALYFINNIDNEAIVGRSRHAVMVNAVTFLVFFLAFVIRTLLKDGYAYLPESGSRPTRGALADLTVTTVHAAEKW